MKRFLLLSSVAALFFAGVAVAATCKDAGGVCVEYPAICEMEYKGTISKAGTCSGTEDCCMPPKVAAPSVAAPAGFLRLQLPTCTQSGNCLLDDIVATGAAFANLLTALSAALFFGTFVYGGARYLLSFGRKE